LHGPHHEAQNSTRTGSSLSITRDCHVAFVTSGTAIEQLRSENTTTDENIGIGTKKEKSTTINTNIGIVPRKKNQGQLPQA
jgi:hypothetical protein